jgi:hypothetical protein
VWDDCSREFPRLVRAPNEFGDRIAITPIAFKRFAMHLRESKPSKAGVIPASRRSPTRSTREPVPPPKPR